MSRDDRQRCGAPAGCEGSAISSLSLADSNLGLIGNSPAMTHLRETIRLAAASHRTVMVTGPTGAGKELVVRAIHAAGPRAHRALLEINCGALSPSLVESQLFGHERGAFTGAERRTEGLFTAAGDGTLFLDEVAELPLELQAKLLRVLEAGTFRRLGSTLELRSEARVVAATHADLESMVHQGRFREDLYYRLNVLEVRVPSLGQRIQDLPLLIQHLVDELGVPMSFTASAREMLEAYPWPGNVRQLRNLVERLAVFGATLPVDGDTLLRFLGRSRVADDTRSLVSRVLVQEPGTNKIDAVVGLLIGEAMRQAEGNRSAAARMLGVHRKVLERRLEKYKEGDAGAL